VSRIISPREKAVLTLAKRAPAGGRTDGRIGKTGEIPLPFAEPLSSEWNNNPDAL